MTSEFSLLGFPDEKQLLVEIGSALNQEPEFAQQEYFAAGELRIRGPKVVKPTTIVVTNIHAHPERIWRACLLAQAVRHHGATRVLLISPWIAYGRQDRVVERGSAPAGSLLVDG